MRIGLIGCGTVGQSVLQILQSKASHLKNMGLNNLTVAKIAVNDINKQRMYVPENSVIVNNINEIIDDESIDCVVEVMGGNTIATDAICKAITKGKHVITANKAALSENLSKILDLTKKHNVNLGYEAAICGGIPIVHTLQRDFICDDITAIYGIFNGTTNFILSKMTNDSIDYKTALQIATENGFAEVDPTADVEGYDVRAKIALLVRLGMGVNINNDLIPTKGITQISKIDLLYAKRFNWKIKLLGIARIIDNNLTVYVTPHMVPISNFVARIENETNIVNIESEYLRMSKLIGIGAGGLATANSVISDLISLEKNEISAPFPKDKEIKLKLDYISNFYIRLSVKGDINTINDKIKTLANIYGIYISSVNNLYNTYRDDVNFDYVITTTQTTNDSKIKEFCLALNKESFNSDEPFYMPVLSNT